FADKSGTAALRAQVHDSPPSFSEIAPEQAVPPDVEALVFRAMAKDKAARFASMREMHEAILAIPPDAGASLSMRTSPQGVPPSSASASMRTTASYSAAYGEAESETSSPRSSASSSSSSSSASSSSSSSSSSNSSGSSSSGARPAASTREKL